MNIWSLPNTINKPGKWMIKKSTSQLPNEENPSEMKAQRDEVWKRKWKVALTSRLRWGNKYSAKQKIYAKKNPKHKNSTTKKNYIKNWENYKVIKLLPHTKAEKEQYKEEPMLGNGQFGAKWKKNWCMCRTPTDRSGKACIKASKQRPEKWRTSSGEPRPSSGLSPYLYLIYAISEELKYTRLARIICWDELERVNVHHWFNINR